MSDHPHDDEDPGEAQANPKRGSIDPTESWDQTAPPIFEEGEETLGAEVDGMTASDVGDSEYTTAVGEDEAGGALHAKILSRLDHAPDSAGETLLGAEIGGRFTVVSRIGSGGFGVVYKARQKGMDRDVAIKVLLANLGENATVVRRFHLEALAVSKLRHPNTIQIYDFGETDAGQLYIAMEYLDGISLQDALRAEGAMSARRAVHIIVQMARSLREAHAKGIIHRDLKPDNIFLCRVGEEADFVKVLDFGVAKLREGDENQGTLTQAGMIFGTPRYMSPEQARASEVDQRSDLYALGVILYELLTGSPPFDGANHLEILIKHIQESPVPLHTRRPDLVFPPEVSDLVFKLLSKQASQRPATSEALIREGEEILQSLDDIYRNVLTRDDAVRAGLEMEKGGETLVDTVMGLSAPEANTTMGNVGMEEEAEDPVPTSPRRRWVSFAIGSLLVGGVGLGLALFNLERLPDAYQGLNPDVREIIEVGAIASPPVPSVAVSLTSEPEGAEVYFQGTLLLQTPSSIDKPMGHEAMSVEFRHPGYQSRTLTVEFAKSLTHHAVLEPEQAADVAPSPPRPAPGVRAVKPPSPPAVKDKTSRRGEVKPSASAKPDPFTKNRKVRTLKKNPF